MAIGALATAGFALSVSIIALHIVSFLDQSGTTTTAQTPPAPTNSPLPDLLLLAVMEGLVTAVAFIYHHKHRVAGAGAGSGNRRISELGTFILCVLTGFLLFLLFVQPAGGANDDAQAQALSTFAVRALPPAATVAFYLGVMLIYAHVGNGVVGANGGAIAGGGPPQASAVCILAKITFGAAAAVVSLVVTAEF